MMALERVSPDWTDGVCFGDRHCLLSSHAPGCLSQTGRWKGRVRGVLAGLPGPNRRCGVHSGRTVCGPIPEGEPRQHPWLRGRDRSRWSALRLLPQQEMVHGFVDPVAADGKPVVDAAQRCQDVALNARSPQQSRGRRLARCFRLPSGWPFGRHHSSRPPLLSAGNDRNPEFVVGRVNNDATGGDLLHRGKGGLGRVRGGRDVGTNCRRQWCVRPPARSTRDRVGHEVHSNDSCPSGDDRDMDSRWTCRMAFAVIPVPPPAIAAQ